MTTKIRPEFLRGGVTDFLIQQKTPRNCRRRGIVLSPPRARVGGSGTATWDKALRGLSTLNARAAVSQYHLELEVRGFSAASVWLSPCWLHSCTAPEWLENPRDQPFRLAEPPPAWWPSPALRKRYSRSSKAQTAKARPRPRRGPFKPRARSPSPHPTCDCERLRAHPTPLPPVELHSCCCCRCFSGQYRCLTSSVPAARQGGFAVLGCRAVILVLAVS